MDTVFTVVDLNRKHAVFWQENNERIRHLVSLTHYQNFVSRTIVERKPQSRETLEVHAHHIFCEPSFEAQLFDEENRLKSASPSERLSAYALEPRRKARNGLSRSGIVARFASQPETCTLRTKVLWDPFFEHLGALRLNPARARDAYEYDGQRGRLRITFRQFEKLVSDLVPRRAARKNATATGN